MDVKIMVGRKRYTVNVFTVVLAFSLLVAFAVLAYAYLYYSGTPYFHNLLFLALLCFAVPVGGYFYHRYLQIRNKEYFYPQFLKDLADGTRAGLPLPQAVISVSRVNYGALTDDVRKLATYISWGVPFDEAIRRFAERTGSKMIMSSADLIVEAYVAGGNVADILDTVADDAGKIQFLREERKAKFSGFIGTIYAVYIIFLAMVVVLMNALIPEIPTVPVYRFSGSVPGGPFGGLTTVSLQSVPENEIVAIFLNLAIIEAVFAGIMAGIAGEGSAVAGIKHALILVFVGIFVFQVFVLNPDPKDRIARAVVKMPSTLEVSVNVGRFFVEENIASENVMQYVKEYAGKYNLPSRSTESKLRFEEDPRGCGPCSEGFVEVRPDIIIVKEPTYLDFRVTTDVKNNGYVVYIS